MFSEYDGWDRLSVASTSAESVVRRVGEHEEEFSLSVDGTSPP